MLGGLRQVATRARAGPRIRRKGVARRPFGACSQDFGFMITGPPTEDWRTPLQDFETLYIAGAKLAVVRRGLPSAGATDPEFL